MEVFTFTEALSIDKRQNKIQSIETTKGTIKTPIVINAAGGHAQLIGDMAGIDIPVYSQNHEILVTEPIEKTQGPMVISFSKNIYCQQTPHGAFIMGRGDDREAGLSQCSTHTFLDAMAKTVTDLLPPLGELRVIRQWADFTTCRLITNQSSLRHTSKAFISRADFQAMALCSRR